MKGENKAEAAISKQRNYDVAGAQEARVAELKTMTELKAQLMPVMDAYYKQKNAETNARLAEAEKWTRFWASLASANRGGGGGSGNPSFYEQMQETSRKTNCSFYAGEKGSVAAWARGLNAC